MNDKLRLDATKECDIARNNVRRLKITFLLQNSASAKVLTEDI